MFPFFLPLLLSAGMNASADPGVPWNVALHYKDAGLSIIDAARIPPMLKDTRLFGVAASYPVVGYQVDWLDSEAKVIFSATMEIGLGMRVPPDCGDGANLVPEEGAVEFRAIGPPEGTDPMWIRLTWLNGNYYPVSDLPLAFQWKTIALPIPRGGDKGTIPEEILGITKIRDTGDDANRIVVVIMPDGYTAENLAAGLFIEDTERLLEVWATCSPWDEYWNLVNIYRMDVVSQEEGVDIPAEGIFVDTYFDVSLSESNVVSEYNVIKATNLFFSPGIVDGRLMIVNYDSYGGRGLSAVAITQNGPDVGDVGLHEMGHHFANLADEYEIRVYQRERPTSTDGRPNWSPTYALKTLPWKVWVEDGTPLPTPETEEYKAIAGAFEGANDWPTDVYRPYLDCKMRNSNQPFCNVCVEAHIMNIIQKVQLTVSISPPRPAPVVLGSQEQEFKVVPLDVPSLHYQWKLGTQIIADATGPSVSLSASDLETDVGYLYLTITHTSPHIRKTPPYKRYTWVLNKETSGVKDWDVYPE